MEWTIDRIKSFIQNKVEENLNLDYKAADSLQHNDKKANEIAKDISAFANSDGGTIIYGIKENENEKHLPDSIDPVNRNEISKEWLEQIIQSRIRPKIENIKIYPIPVDDSSERVIYVVEIPQSDTAHQANDKKYYKRYNFSSEPMYDYEIRDILNRIKFPIIDLEFKITKKTYEIKPPDPQMPRFTIDEKGFPKPIEPQKEYKTDYWLHIYAQNNGKVLANYINAYVFVPSKFIEGKDSSSDTMSQYYLDNTIRDVVDAEILPLMNGTRTIPKYGPSRYEPILPRRDMRLEKIMLNDSFLKADDKIEFIVFSDNSEPRRGDVKINEIEIEIKKK